MERIKDVCVGDLGEGVQIQKRGRPIFFGTVSSVGQQTLYLDYSIARFILIIIYQEQIIKRPETASTSSGVIIITIIIAMIMMMTITIMMLITITIFNITTMIMIMIIIIIIMINRGRAICQTRKQKRKRMLSGPPSSPNAAVAPTVNHAVNLALESLSWTILLFVEKAVLRVEVAL